MIYIPVRDYHYMDAIIEAGECPPEGTRVLAWVNYLKDINIKRYYIAEKYKSEWYYITVDVFPEDKTIWWNISTRDAMERDNYIDSSYYFYWLEDNDVVIQVDPLEPLYIEDEEDPLNKV
jgi:hypothetical protein